MSPRPLGDDDDQALQHTPAQSARLAFAAVGLLIVGVTCGAALARPQQGKLDESVAELIDAARDESPLRVIITVAPGARQGIYAKLNAHGAKVNADFTIIEALAAELPPGLIRSLAKDKDVFAISTDAMVKGDGVACALTGDAEASAYTLRRTLGLDSVSRVSRLIDHERSFRQEHDGDVIL